MRRATPHEFALSAPFLKRQFARGKPENPGNSRRNIGRIFPWRNAPPTCSLRAEPPSAPPGPNTDDLPNPTPLLPRGGGGGGKSERPAAARTPRVTEAAAPRGETRYRHENDLTPFRQTLLGADSAAPTISTRGSPARASAMTGRHGRVSPDAPSRARELPRAARRGPPRVPEPARRAPARPRRKRPRRETSTPA